MRREFTKRQKAEIVLRSTNAAGRVTCEGCGLVLGHRPYEIDHVLAEALVLDKSKPLTAADGQLLGVECCHRGGQNKTREDIRRIRKSDRQGFSYRGIKSKPRSSLSHPTLRKKMDGSVVAR